MTFQDQIIFSTDNWFRKLQNDRMFGGRSLTSYGQPAMIVSTSWFNIASSGVSRLTLSSRSVEKQTRYIRTSRSMVVTLFGLGNRDKPSASWFCEPGRCVIVKLCPCNWISICCSLGGADEMGLLEIITKSRWSVMTLKSRPNKYVWNRGIPNTIDKSSHSIQAYRCSVGVGLACIRDGSQLAVCVWLQLQYLSSLLHTACIPVCENHSSVARSCLTLLS